MRFPRSFGPPEAIGGAKRERQAKLALLGGAALLLAACAAPPGTVDLSKAKPKGAIQASSTGVYLSLAQIKQLLKLVLDPTLALDPEAQAIMAFTNAEVTAFSPSRMAEPAAAQLTPEQFEQGVELTTPGAYALAALQAGETRTLTPPFSKLPSYRDLEFRAYLLDDGGRLMGCGVKTNIDWEAAKKEIPIDILPNLERARLIGSTSSVNVSDGVVIKGIELQLGTGVMNAAPGVSAVRVEIYGPAYGDGVEVAELATFKAPELSTYFWKPSNASGTYDPTKLVSNVEPKPFYLKTSVLDTFGRVVATDLLELKYIEGATLNIGIGSGD